MSLRKVHSIVGATSRGIGARAIASLAVAAVALSAPHPASAAVARPDLTGFWMPQETFFAQRAVKPKIEPEQPGGYFYWPDPPLQPWAEKYQRDGKQAELDGKIIDKWTALCLPRGFPMFYLWGPIDVTQRFDRKTGDTAEIAMHSWSERLEARHIWMDGRSHPTGDDLFLQSMGHATGRWEGQTLVVDTVGIDPDTEITSDHIPHTDQLHIVERITLDPGGETMVNEMTLTDPKTFTKPWVIRVRFKRHNEREEQVEQVCDVRKRGSFGKPGDFEGAEIVGGYLPSAKPEGSGAR